MYLFRKKDGTLSPAPEGFDSKNPDWEVLHDVEEVLVISKVLVPEIKLVPRTPGAGADRKQSVTSPKTTRGSK